MRDLNIEAMVSPTMTATLSIIAGPDAGRSCELPAGSVLVIGRGRDCGLRLSDPGVSRIHCRLIAEGNAVRVEDADSRFGTLVNHRPIFVQTLLSGDTIEIGDTKLRFNCGRSSVETIMPLRLAALPSELLPAESMTFDASDLGPSNTCVLDAKDLIGVTFVRFKIEALISESASGVIYQAIDHGNSQPVALKIFWPALFADEHATSRFLRSMRTMIPLDHEHLVKLYTAGRSGGLCFTASEFVTGESVAQMIARIGIAGMLDWRTTWRIAVGLTAALSYLHERQILHRSLRPGNILIRQSDRCVKLGDSLLAKSLDQIGQTALTARRDVVGDIHYVSPEQLTGGSTVDHRADIFSLGATLYALLTGRPPFLGSAAEVIRQILTATPCPPKQLHLAIPTALEGIVLRMLSKRPEDRFPDAHSILNELQRFGRYEGLI